MTTTYSTQVAAEIRGQLARKGKGASDLVATLGVSMPTARARWRGDAPYTLDELPKIAEALDLPLAEFLQQVSA